MGATEVVLVDTEGNVLGSAAKLAAHQPPGQLHLAFSIFLYRPDGALLLQRRAAGKYHFPLVWANTCCSHPAPGEDGLASARARLGEELGIDAELTDVGTIIYRATCPDSGLVEHELDHVLIGNTEDEPQANPDEVADLAWLPADDVLSDRFTERRAPWLAPALLVAERARRRGEGSPAR